MVCLFARIGVALGRMVNHVFTQTGAPGCGCGKKAASGTRWFYGHNFEEYLTTYLN